MLPAFQNAFAQTELGAHPPERQSLRMSYGTVTG
jgi:hypothetical protein